MRVHFQRRACFVPYHLFLSFNHCCKREETRYQVRMGRAKEMTGPYYDKRGWPRRSAAAGW